MMTETMKVALTITSLMIMCLSVIAFGYSMKQLVHMFIVAFKDEGPY